MEEAHAAYQVLARESPDNLGFQLYLGILAARLSQRDEAARVDSLLAAQELPYERGQLAVNRARIAAALGDRERAVNLLQDAFSRGTGYGIWLHREPAFDGLRDYPAFLELLRPKG